MAATRHFEDWIEAFIDFASYCEAPKHIYFWVAISAIAGALARRVYIEQYMFRWYPNFYIILVAPPEVIAKSTSTSLGMRLLRKVPGVKFGPNVITWQALIKHLSVVPEEIEIAPGVFEKMNCLIIESSELGNLLDPQDRQMIDMLVTLWDGHPIIKETLSSGIQTVADPLLNIIACTTPAWLTDAIPQYMRGGGLFSRIIFVAAHKKGRLIANPGLHIPPDMAEREQALVDDLTAMSLLKGEMSFTRAAIDWTEVWYKELHDKRGQSGAPDHATRRQTMLYKLAMVLSIARRDTLVITEQEFIDANAALTALEPEAKKVYRNIGQKADAHVLDRLISSVQQAGSISLEVIYQEFLSFVPRANDLDTMIKGAVKTGLIEVITGPAGLILQARNSLPEKK